MAKNPKPIRKITKLYEFACRHNIGFFMFDACNRYEITLYCLDGIKYEFKAWRS